MIKTISAMTGWEIQGSDARIGRVMDLIFDWKDWEVRFIATEMDTEQWNLIPAMQRKHGMMVEGTIDVPISLEKARNSPSMLPGQAVAERLFEKLDDLEHWPEKAQGSQNSGSPVPGREPFYLRSAKEVMDYRVRARDGEAGHVADFIVDLRSWAVLYLVIDAGLWLAERKVLLAPAWIDEIRWPEREIRMDLKRRTIELSPEYDPNTPVSRAYEERLYTHYQRPGYWDSRNRRIF